MAGVNVMRTARISEYRSNLSSYHQSVLEDREPLRIVGGPRGDVVVIPAIDFEELQDTIGVLKDRATMNSLLENRADFQDQGVNNSDISKAFNDVLERENK